VTDDVSLISQLILHEREGRDRGWFDQEASAFLPDSTVKVSWFDGSGADFVAGSRKSFDAGVHPVHHMCAPVVHVQGDRGVVEVSADIASEGQWGGIDAYVVASCRLLYTVEKRDGTWGIASMTCIYERDTVVPVNVGETPQVDPAELAKYRKPYRNLAYQLASLGTPPGDDLWGDDQPEKLKGLYDQVFSWMRGAA
jgi:hypothetical protein